MAGANHAVLAAGIALGVATGSAWPQEPARTDAANPFGRKYPARVYRTVRLQGPPPAIDGRLDDDAWSQGKWEGGYSQQIPVEGAPPSKPTELLILYDDTSVYFAVRAYDDPDRVHRYPGRRDEFTGDVVGVCFDSYNDRRTGFEFNLTAGGSKIDLVLGNGETEWDTSWNAVWDGEVAHDENGWTAEFRVPLNQLRYGPQQEQVWGLHAWRWIDRHQEEDQWQLIPRQNTGRMHQLGELRGIQGLKRSRHVELLPYAQSRAASEAGGRAGIDASGAVGLDARVGLTTNFTLDASVNPDFGQVEADPSVVNLTAYETFYDEKRPFFLEGTKIFGFDMDDGNRLFYTRRIGQSPVYPAQPGGETNRPPEATILAAVKVTGKTPQGLAVGLLQGVTRENTAFASPLAGQPVEAAEPFGSYTVARLRKDWGRGNTSLGGIFTSAHRWSAPIPSFAAGQATSGGIEFTRYFADRSWILEANGIVSRITGAPEAILALQTNAVHGYQRPDADHLAVKPGATSLDGHGGSVRFGRSDASRLRLSDRFGWYSPGLELNDLGYLRQADLLANQVFLGWTESSPKGVFRDYSLGLSRADEWDFGGLRSKATTAVEASGQFSNKWRASARFAFDQVVDTRALRGGPALRWHDYFTGFLSAGSDPSRRASVSVEAEHAWAVDDDSRSSEVEAELFVRPSNRFSLSGAISFEQLADELQYVATADTDGGPRWVLGRMLQDSWSLTFRANLSITPELTIQYYGSPFIGTGRYARFKRATDTLAARNADRFHAYGTGEISYAAPENRYRVVETAGGPGSSYTFSNPDFTFRQFRSNLVARWEYRPGSSIYLVWSQGRTGSAAAWQPSLSSSWDALWRLRPDNVFLVKLSYWLSP